MLEVISHRCIAVVVILVCWSLAQSEFTDPSQVTALKAIRSNLNDPMSYLNWTTGDPCTSNWRGVMCYNTTAEHGILHVQELHLLNMNLSGRLSPKLGQLSRLEILNFMWNKITGSIPKEIGKITSLKLLLLNGNCLSGPLPVEIGNLLNLERLQIDQNHISGILPKSFARLRMAEHFHMNNNTISGRIPAEFSQLSSILHILLDNNNLTGDLPAELSKLPKLEILQLDNNNFNGASIPFSYGSMKNLLKLSLRNCSLQGSVPDLSRIPSLGYLDLSWNKLNGSIPANKLSQNVTTIDLSNNKLSGNISSNFSGLPFLQRLSLDNNNLTGSVPSNIWKYARPRANGSVILNFQNNMLTEISDVSDPPENVTVLLQGNPLCENSIVQFCRSQRMQQAPGSSSNSKIICQKKTDVLCPFEASYEYNKASTKCMCAAPVRVGFRLKSPGFSDFRPYKPVFVEYLTSGLKLNIHQLYIDSFMWEEGPRLRMYLKFFPHNTSIFNTSEILEIRTILTRWEIPDKDVFGPYEVLNFTLLGPYKDVIILKGSSSGLDKGTVVGIIFGVIAVIVICTAIIWILILKRKIGYQKMVSKKRQLSRIQIKIDNVKDFTFGELSQATRKFSESSLVGQGGYGKVYKGILADGMEVAIKRAQEASLQGSKEFFTEIELLSKLHHRNLVSLFGYCDEEEEQMLVYEFMPNGTLRDHLSAKSKEPLSYFMRLRIALDSAKGILYLHTEVVPPIFHRDIKASNILLDSKFTAKVADFGLSRLVPELDPDGSGIGHVSTVVKGTPGYLDPEYFLSHKLTDKSDVYSLGIVFLELLTGMLPISHGRNIVREVNLACQSGGALSVIDKRMEPYPSVCVERFLALALRCCQDDLDARPSMLEVVRELESIKLMYPDAHTTSSDSIATGSSNEAITTQPLMASGGICLDSNVIASNLTNHDMPSTINPR